ncbi:MAG TPA: hypothetical protein VGK16_04005 [Candidatus Limnocylindrales bacterium]
MTGSPAQLSARISSIEDAERARQSAIRARFQERFGHPRGPALAREEAAWWRSAEVARPADKPGADAVGAAAIDAYLVSGPTERDDLRAAFASAPFCRWRLGWASATDRVTGDPRVGTDLERALAGVTLRTDGSDVRDLILSLDRICLDALRHGEDPFPALRIAEQRARDAHDDETPASRLLAGYLAPDRQAALRGAGRP